MEKILLQKLIDTQLVKKFPAFYGSRKFITEPITGPFPQTDASSPHIPTLFA